jgi:hypothetical protein
MLYTLVIDVTQLGLFTALTPSVPLSRPLSLGEGEAITLLHEGEGQGMRVKITLTA